MFTIDGNPRRTITIRWFGWSGQLVDECRDIRTEQRVQLLKRDRRILDDIVQERCGNHSVVMGNAADNFGDRDGMDDVGFERIFTTLVDRRMRLRRKSPGFIFNGQSHLAVRSKALRRHVIV